MKRILLFIAAVSVAVFSCYAQIQLTPYVSATSGGLDENNTSVIETRLRTLISKMGMESGYGTRFVLAVKANLLDRYMTGGAPARIGQKMQVTIAVGDAESGTCFGSCTQEVKGSGQTEQAAMLAAFRNISPTDELKSLIAESKQRIINYYNTNGPSIIQKAKGLIVAQKWEEALYELSAIPNECGCFSQAQAMMIQVYQEHINHDASQVLAEARAVWSADPNPGPAAEQAMSILSTINTSAKCYPQAQALMKSIETRIKNVTDKKYNDAISMEKARLNTAATLEKARLNACRDVAVAYAKSRPRVIYRTINRWW